MRLKRWESPRKEGRNNKGRGGSARQRQLKKRQQMLRLRLKDDNNTDQDKDKNNNNNGGKKIYSSPSFFAYIARKLKTIFFSAKTTKKDSDSM
jgi:hypothetical protein